MKKAGFCIWCVLSLAGVCWAQVVNIDPIVPRRAMVRIADYSSIDQFLTLFNQRWPGTTVVDSLPEQNTYLLEYTVESDLQAQLLGDELENLYTNLTPDVPNPSRPLIWGELDYEGRSGEGRTGSVYTSGPQLSLATARDQYALTQLRVQDAHQQSTGRAVTVAVLDTGVDATHPQYSGRVLPGATFLSGDVGPRGAGGPMAAHGTYVAGLVNLMAPEANILPVTVLNGDGVGTAWDIGRGIYYAVNHGAEVINLSLGSTYDSAIVEDAVAEAARHGIVVVAALGNMNREEPEEYPALTEADIKIDGIPTEVSVIGVAGVNDLDRRADFSNYNDKAVIAAPGASARMASNPDEYDLSRSVISTIPDGGYAIWEGTSFSSAFVSGAVALVRSQHPEWPNDATTYQTVVQQLTTTADNIDSVNPGYAGLLGAGRVDAAGATSSGPGQPLLGDLNNDGRVDSDDLGILLADYFKTHSPADFNGDGVVNNFDLGMLLANYLEEGRG